MALVNITPMLPAVRLMDSVDFYRRLGFAVDQIREDWGWASVSLSGFRIMLDHSIANGESAAQNSVVYLYAQDLQDFRQRAIDAGLHLPTISSTFYDMNEFRVVDPSGNQIWVGQANAKSAT